MNQVFVYGTLKKGGSNHRLMDGSELIAKGETVRPYAMYSNGGYPVCFRDEEHGWIAGEAYLVNDAILNILDRLEGHPRFFCRHQVPVKLSNTSEITNCWMYFGDGFGDRSHLKQVALNCSYFEWPQYA